MKSVIAVYKDLVTALGTELESSAQLSAPGSLPPIVATALLRQDPIPLVSPG